MTSQSDEFSPLFDAPEDCAVLSEDFKQDVVDKLTERRQQQAQQMDGWLFPDWKVERGPLAKSEPVKCLCIHCMRYMPTTMTYSKAKRHHTLGTAPRPCVCRKFASVLDELDLLLSSEWVVNYSLGSSLKPNHIVCENGHERYVTLRQVRQEARKSPDNRVWCNRCKNPDAGTTPVPSTDNPFLYPKEYEA